MVDKLLIFTRNWECIYARNLENEWNSNITSRLSQISISPSNEIMQVIGNGFDGKNAVDDESKLLIGTIYSLQKVMVRMLEIPNNSDSFDPNEISITADNEEVRLHYYESPTKLRFMAICKSSYIETQNLLSDFYREVFVPFACRNPLILRSSDISFAGLYCSSAFKQETLKYFKRLAQPK